MHGGGGVGERAGLGEGIGAGEGLAAVPWVHAVNEQTTASAMASGLALGLSWGPPPRGGASSSGGSWRDGWT